MNDILLPLYSASQTRELDHLAIKDEGIPGYTLMKRAAACTFHHIMTAWPSCKRMIILCGIGNNGGDGYVIAQLAKARGLQVHAYQLGDLSRQKGDALTARKAMETQGILPVSYSKEIVLEADIVVDAILGTGLERPVQGLWLSAINAINDSESSVCAVDIPSGLNANTGGILGDAVKADLTVTFIGRKKGLFTADAKACTGKILFDSLDIPVHLYDQVKSQTFLLPKNLTGPMLFERQANCHKGQFGHVLIVGGAPGMSGAVTMAAMAALRSGCGLVSVATHPSHSNSVNQHQPEIMSHGIDKPEQLRPLVNTADVIVFGPGLGKSKWSKEIGEYILKSNKMMIVDADGLNLIANNSLQKDNWVLTPHPGEAARLIKTDTQNIQNNRFDSVKQIQKQYGGICVLKGAGTLLFEGSKTLVCSTGNPGMASAGMGDVLSGIVGSLCAQYQNTDIDIYEVVSFAVSLHSRAGDAAAKQGGEKGLLATDLLPFVRSLINDK